MIEPSMASLCLNYLSLALCGLLAIRAFRTNNIIALIYWLVFAFLVVGQGIHISVSLIDAPVGRYLFNYIDRDGHLLASFLTAAIIIFCGSLSFVISPCNRSLFGPVSSEARTLFSRKSIHLYNLFNWLVLVILSLAIVKLVGGVDEWVASSRPVASGSTFFMIGLTLVQFPLLIKVASNIKVRFNDLLLYIISCVVIMSFSRITAIIQLLILLLVYYYSSPLRGKSLSINRHKRLLYGVLFLIVMVFFGFGSYRHALSGASASGIALDQIFSSIMEHPEESLFSLDLNYRIGIEGMTGFSGVISSALQTGDLKADFGLSLLAVSFQLVPSFFRGAFLDIQDHLGSLYWYKGSIVPGGLEGMLVHFSFFGVLVFALGLFGLAYMVHLSLVSKASYTFRTTNIRLLAYSIVASYGIMFIRGSTSTLLFYMASELIVMVIAVNMFSRLAYRDRKTTADMTNNMELQPNVNSHSR